MKLTNERTKPTIRRSPALEGALAGVLLVPLLVSGVRAGEKLSVEFRQVVDFEGTRVLVRNSRGEVLIEGGGPEGQVIVKGTKRVYAKDEATASRYLKRLEIRIEQEEGTLGIQVQYPDRRESGSFLEHLFGESTRATADLRIQVPRTMGATVLTASGDVVLSGMEGGSYRVTGSSGDVELEDLGGDSEVTVSSGDVTIERIRGNVAVTGSSCDLLFRDIEGNVQATVSTGDMVVHRVEGNVDARTVAGDFELRGCQGHVRFKGSSGDVVILDTEGNIEVKTSSGDVELELTPGVGRHYLVNTASGDVDISYHPAQGYSLVIFTANGEISASVPIEISKIDRNRLEGIVGGGGETVMKVETSSGSVDIVELLPED
jgi:DUF4097 and DUF4098 domain-containing protein YvlB